MAGLVPAIHVFLSSLSISKQDVDGRDKFGHEVESVSVTAGSVWAEPLCHFPPFSTLPHLSSITRASSCESADVVGNLSFHANGRHASMIAFECEVTPRALASGAILGSSAELQALCTMSICSDGSQRVVIAHMTSARLDGST